MKPSPPIRPLFSSPWLGVKDHLERRVVVVSSPARGFRAIASSDSPALPYHTFTVSFDSR